FLGAVNISVGQISEDNPKISSLDKNAKIVVYCVAGGRAQQAKLKLEKLGFTNVENGINQQEVTERYLL
ncbi:MAG TPA: rhodanese-like domain-containing protein, partial [Candidatus Saccharimonadales bacterium]|nr:rhodanese-like domain-containing protein [Candidatus Saccharimonadales bacterium]